MLNSVILRIIDMPSPVRGVTVPSSDGYYNIYINAKYPYEVQQKILKHELKHVKNNDFYNFDNISELENRAK